MMVGRPEETGELLKNKINPIANRVHVAFSISSPAAIDDEGVADARALTPFVYP
jgi:hypothetical protein